MTKKQTAMSVKGHVQLYTTNKHTGAKIKIMLLLGLIAYLLRIYQYNSSILPNSSTVLGILGC